MSATLCLFPLNLLTSATVLRGDNKARRQLASLAQVRVRRSSVASLNETRGELGALVDGYGEELE